MGFVMIFSYVLFVGLSPRPIAAGLLLPVALLPSCHISLNKRFFLFVCFLIRSSYVTLIALAVLGLTL